MKIALNLLLALGLAAAPALADEPGAPVTVAKAAELALHRVERLVILRRIPEQFLTQVATLEVSKVDPVGEDGVKYRAVVSLLPSPEGKASRLELFMDAIGKTLRHVAHTEAPAQGAPVWPDKDPVTLAENALHYILDESVNRPELVPFNDTFEAASLTQETAEDGSVLGLLEVRSVATRDLLRIRVRADGTYLSHEVVSPAGG